MRKSYWWLGLVLVAACSGESPAECTGTDAECLFSSMTFHDFDLEPGPALALSSVRTDALIDLWARDYAADGELSPVRVSGPESLSFVGAGIGEGFTFSWDDSFGCRPAFCFSACPRNARCVAASSCSEMVRDGQTSGVTQHWLTFEKPVEHTVELDLMVAPVSGPGCAGGVAALLEAASTEIQVGPAARITVEVPGSGPGTGTNDEPPPTDACAGGLHASTAACTPLGSGGSLDTCISRSEYASATGMSLPASAAPDGTSGCMDTQRGVVVKPCAIGSTCRVGSACGGGSTFGGVCGR